MRRRPEEDEGEEEKAFEPEIAGRGRPSDDRREGAGSAAATKFTASAITVTLAIDSTTPKASASAGSMRPAGIGRSLVRVISASMSRSYHMLMAPAAPAPTAMHSTAIAASRG